MQAHTTSCKRMQTYANLCTRMQTNANLQGVRKQIVGAKLVTLHFAVFMLGILLHFHNFVKFVNFVTLEKFS